MPSFDPAQLFALLRRVFKAVPFSRELLSMYYALLDERTPVWVKATVAGAIVYFIAPLDTVPDVLPLLGFTDDAGVVFGAYRAVAAHITDSHRAQAEDWLATNG